MPNLGQIRKVLQPDVCTDVKVIMKLFIHICKHNPQAVINAFSDRMKADQPERMVQFYQQNAEYLKELFEYS